MTEIRITIDDEEARRKLDRLERELKEARREAENLDRATSGGGRTGSSRGTFGARRAAGGGGGGGVGSVLGKAAGAVAVAAVAAEVAKQVVNAIGEAVEGPIGDLLQEKAAQIDKVLNEKQAQFTGLAAAGEAAAAFGRGGTPLTPAQLNAVRSEAVGIARREAAVAGRARSRTAAIGFNYLGAFLGGGGGE